MLKEEKIKREGSGSNSKKRVRSGDDEEEDGGVKLGTLLQDLRPSPASTRYVTRSASGSRTPGATTLSYPRKNLNQKNMSPPATRHPSRLPPYVPVILTAAAGPSRYSDRGNNTTRLADIARNQKNVTDVVDKSTSAESSDWSAPISKASLDLDDLTSKLVLPQSEEPRQVSLVPVKKSDDIAVPEKSTANRGGISFSITEFAKTLLDKSRDDPIEEVESTFDQTLEDVKGYKVKKDVAPLLRSIFEKYGDIACESNVASPTIVSFFLERLCDVYQKLELSELSMIIPDQVRDMLAEVGYLETQKLNIGWLRERLEQISQTKIEINKSLGLYLDLTEEAKKHEVSVARMKREVSVLRHKVSEAEKELAAEELMANETTRLARDLKARIKSHKQSMVDGLL